MRDDIVWRESDAWLSLIGRIVSCSPALVGLGLVVLIWMRVVPATAIPTTVFGMPIDLVYMPVAWIVMFIGFGIMILAYLNAKRHTKSLRPLQQTSRN